MRTRTLQRAAVLLLALVAVQGGASAMADGKQPPSRSAPAPSAGRPGSANPLTPFQQGASMFAGMAAPFMDAASDVSDVMFPRN